MRRARTQPPPSANTPLLANAVALLALANTIVATAALTTSHTSKTTTPDSLSALGAILPPFVRDNFDELVKAASAACEALPEQLLFSRASSVALPLTQLVEFTRGASRVLSVRRAAERLRLRLQRPLVLYVPGWWNTPTDTSSQAIVDALLTRHPAVLLLDTRLSFCRGYVGAVSSVIPLSYLLYGFMKKLHKSGYPVSSVHLVGFSLGAHVAGLAGKLVRKNLNTTLGRITALDPARPCFARTEYRLDKRDAKFVQVIHSSTGVLGLEEPVGHVDVYVNGLPGKHPECQDRSISLECDHARAWKLYSASAMNEKALTGRQCASWEELTRDACSGNETVLGYACSTDARGLFLYRSRQKMKPRSQRLRIFNPFNILRWPFDTLQN